MTPPEITIAIPADRERVTGTLVAAFVKDPVIRHLFPDEATYPRYAAAFFGYLFDKRVHRQTIWMVEQGASVAIWEASSPVPAGSASAGSIPAWSAAADRPSVAPMLRAPLVAQLPADVLARVDAYDEAVRAALPTGRFWYLGVLGTDPDRAGRGLGRAVMAAGLRQAVADGLPAILETSNPANVEWYAALAGSCRGS